jgi:hypothetical protein
MKAEELDRKFDNGDEVLGHFDISTMKRLGLEINHIVIDFPQWMLEAIDREAQRLGIQRQAVIKVWIAERLDASGALEAQNAPDALNCNN